MAGAACPYGALLPRFLQVFLQLLHAPHALLEPRLGPLASGHLRLSLAAHCLATAAAGVRAPRPPGCGGPRPRALCCTSLGPLCATSGLTLLAHRLQLPPELVALTRPLLTLALMGLFEVAACSLHGALLLQRPGAVRLPQRAAELRELLLQQRSGLALLRGLRQAAGALAARGRQKLRVLLLQVVRAQPQGLISLVCPRKAVPSGLGSPLRLCAVIEEASTLALQSFSARDHAEDLPLSLLAPSGLSRKPRFEASARGLRDA
mmetsp:Transcript_25239/g.79614  ORF Transcript_25239/g.79614 Transcript_25239/m.79614 type:complete len:263 (+) Transcript_25239:275-1063(+)